MTYEIMFEIGKDYQNRSGRYSVLDIRGNDMLVQYENDGRQQTLDIEMQKKIVSNMFREDGNTILIARSRDRFFHFVNKCSEHYRDGDDLAFYRKIIEMHRKTETLELMLEDDSFYSLLRTTLEKWNMNQRGARLTSLGNLKESILNHRKELVRLYQYKLQLLSEDRINHEVKGLLWNLFSGLHVMDSKRRIVGVSKALHFLLPDLVMPIDSTYTMQFFYESNKYSKDAKTEFRTFMEIFMKAYGITRRLGLTETDVSGEGWNVSVPKLIDNAIIGLFKYLEIDFRNTQTG
ncbi:MAG: hypothetical protein ACW963_05050 [Candidatus Sifarchaeia archaeon]|jgi:hypothetical protein